LKARLRRQERILGAAREERCPRSGSKRDRVLGLPDSRKWAWKGCNGTKAISGGPKGPREQRTLASYNPGFPQSYAARDTTGSSAQIAMVVARRKEDRAA
jgi:hypothetical protein